VDAPWQDPVVMFWASKQSQRRWQSEIRNDAQGCLLCPGRVVPEIFTPKSHSRFRSPRETLLSPGRSSRAVARRYRLCISFSSMYYYKCQICLFIASFSSEEKRISYPDQMAMRNRDEFIWSRNINLRVCVRTTCDI
jgi:hypothetical protein